MNDGYNTTNVHPVGLSILMVMGLLLLVVPRKYSVWPMIFVACIIPSGQVLAIASLDFSFLRILTVFGAIRVLVRNEFANLRFGSIDQVMVAFALSKSTVFTLQYQSVPALINQLGASFDSLGMYFVFRCLVRSIDDFQGMVLGFVIASIPTAWFFVVENLTGRNLFAFMGGVPEITSIRENKLRCQGPFSCGILAGVFWASIFPLVFARLFNPNQNKPITLISVASIILIILLTSSSTPIMCLIFAVIGGVFFRWRKQMRTVRWTVFAILVCYHISWGKAWGLVAKVNIMGGSTGWHRYYLMDRCIANFGDWWLLGTQDTAKWAEFFMGGQGLGDVTNQYILEGVRGGFLSMVLFITLWVLSFRNVGRMLRTKEISCDRSKTILIWSLGVMLFIHVMTFFAASYFGSVIMLIWLSLGATASVYDTILGAERRLNSNVLPRAAYGRI